MSDDIEPLFSLCRQSLDNFHGLQLTPVPSLEILLLKECSLMSDDIEPLFSLIAWITVSPDNSCSFFGDIVAKGVQSVSFLI